MSLLELDVDLPASTASALCSVSVRIRPGRQSEVLVDDLVLQEMPIFSDGFESGDTSTWSSTAP